MQGEREDSPLCADKSGAGSRSSVRRCYGDVRPAVRSHRQLAEQKGCDLIMMASHGRRGVGALLLGSETQKVLTHSKIPVLVYR